ncbi:serine/threonine protein kinase [Streptomyces sp. NBC_01077]|uniref:serine/threonine-protein kinase n=1 Tax=Streptomyces sp. NBC_01077 TaxID=2903746 RepID=UPI00386AA132|nr:serine/threonine protein kinase [Streptomyces sp. NBC_01077]
MAELAETSLVLDVLAVVGPALVLRAVTVPLLIRAQQAVRRQALADPATPPRSVPGAVVGELALGVVGGVALWFLVRTVASADNFFLFVHPGVLQNGVWVSSVYGYSLAMGWILYVLVVVLASVIWPVLWARTQRTLVTAGVPGDSWTATPAGRLRLGGSVALRIALGLLLPPGLALAAVACQAVAYGVSRRYRHGAGVPDRGAPIPVGRTPVVQAHVGRTPAGQARADAPTVGPAAARPAAYVPTQPDPVAHAVPQFPHRQLLPGEPRTIGGYQLLGRIGAGGMGTVYLARREGAATQVALKTINPELLDNAELLRRFQRESEVLSMVSGAYTARVLDSGVDAGRPYLAMELLDGRPLDAHLGEQGPIRTPEALRALALALAVALSGVHRLGLVHRDLKPANIMLTTAGPRLLDFGIADLVDGTRLTRTGVGPGTLTYMAPEQFGEERVGPAADVWAWACCMVCAAHGTSPFAATSTGAVIRRIVDTGPEPAALAAVRALDPELAAAVERALTVDPADRPADGAGLVDLLTSQGSPHHEPTQVDAVREEITRGWRTLAL